MSCKKLSTGLLITIEGVDGSGKSSIAKILNDHLIKLGYAVKLTKEPGASELGKNLRTLLHERKFKLSDKSEFLLFASDRAQHIFEIVEPALASGTIVISDRMADSSLAYQGFGRNLNRDMIKEINNWVMNNHIPDLTLYLKIDYQTALRRVQKRGNNLTHFEKEKRDFFARVIEGYENIFKNRCNAISIDASKSLEIVANEAIEATLNFLKLRSAPLN